MNKVDLKKEWKNLYIAKKETPVIFEVPKINCLMIDGKGHPDISETFGKAIEALYNIAYGIKFSLKENGFDYVVPPLEGVWWMDGAEQWDLQDKTKWRWTLMIPQPNQVTKAVFSEVVEKLTIKKKNPLFSQVRFESFNEGEGLSAQVLHIGSYDDEVKTINTLFSFISEKGYEINGKHHEVYLSDPRKTEQAKLKTILRYPIKKKI